MEPFGTEPVAKNLRDGGAEELAKPVSVEAKPGRNHAGLPIKQFLDCQSKVLRYISQKSSPRKTLIPLFDLAQELLGVSACGVEVISHRSDLLHHLNFRNLPAELIKSTERRPARERMSIGAQAIVEKKNLQIVIKDCADSCVPEPVLNALTEADIGAVWARPLFGEADEGPIGALTLYFKDALPDGEHIGEIVDFLTEMAEHATLHRHSREAKKVADDRFAVLVESVPGVVYQRVVTPDGQIRYTYISDAAEELFGVTAEEILSNPDALFETHGEGYREGFHNRLIEASNSLSMWDVEATIVTRDGKKKNTHAIARPVKQADGTVVWNGIILDTTRIKETEKLTALAERRTREAIVKSLNQGFVLFDTNDQLVISNPQLKTYYPILEEYLRPGTPLAEFLDAEHRLGLRSDDENEDEDIASNLDIDLDTGLSQAVERRLSNGHWLRVQAFCPDGQETVIQYSDVSDIKDRQIALEQSNRELQDFASVASHDLQEPLRKIEAFGGRLKDRCGDDLSDKGVFYLDRMQSAAVRMRSLINDLLSYSRVTSQAKPFVPCNMDRIVHEVLSDLQMQVEDIAAQIEVSGLCEINADPLQMRQLMQNVIGNALKYHREGVPHLVRIEGRVVRTDTADYLEISISDNGIGFDMRFADKIFSVFQRLHGQNEYPGTGIGLATCRKIVDRHFGEINADSKEGEGSVFRIVLPMVQNNEVEA